MVAGAARQVADARSDGELWSAGDRESFAVLYERHAEAVWNYAYRLTASWSAADDLLGTVFLTAWRRRSSVRLVGDSALPWLKGVAATLTRGERRRLSRQIRALERMVDREPEPDPAERIARSSGDRYRLAMVLAAVARLPRRERAAVELCLLGQMPVREAAVVLGVGEAGLRSQLSRARRRLKDLVEEEWDD